MVTERQTRLLTIVGGLQPAVIQQLVARDGSSRRSVTSCLRRLRDQGLVKVDVRKQTGGNWIWRYSLTEEGQECLGLEEADPVPFDPFWAEIDKAIASAQRTAKANKKWRKQQSENLSRSRVVKNEILG